MADKRFLSESSDEEPPLKSRRLSSDDFSQGETHESDNNDDEYEGNSHPQSMPWKKDDLSQSTSSSDEEEERKMRSFGSSYRDRFDKLTKPVTEPNFENTKVQRMLDNMGHQKGKGLGKFGQGRVAPVELSTQRGRQGLGFSVKGLEAETLEWDSSQEVINVYEEVAWLEEMNHTPLDSCTLDSWIKEGPIKLIIDDETQFCDPEILHHVLLSKSVFDKLQPLEMRKARMRSNPFETIRGGIFLNRAAMKMANMDAVFDFMFTNPVDEANNSLVKQELLYFADVCAGPGGFSEYVLWRKKWEAKGFGFTLKGENDFKLSDFLAGPCESFETHYGVGGLDGDGDVFKPENIMEFTKYVHQRTSFSLINKPGDISKKVTGVHFMMADGGFSVESNENIQEILSKQLYLCQFLVALCIVRPKGHFVCKVFDLFTPFSIGLIYLLYKSFKKISIHKPNTSRPANSERYVICKWKRDDCDTIRDYLFSANEKYMKLRKRDRDIVEIVPMGIIKGDTDFMDYIVKSNNSLGERQVIGLKKIAAFCKDSMLMELRQAELKTSSLEYWKVPDKPRKIPKHLHPNTKLSELLGNDIAWMITPEKILNNANLKECIKAAHEWKCFVVSSTEMEPKLTFYLGLGQGKIFSLQPRSRAGQLVWSEVIDLKLELSPGTLILGETLQEHRGEGRSQQRLKALHIVDAVFLGETDLRNVHLKDRNLMCIKFAEAMKKPLQIEHTPIRAKTLHRLNELHNIFQSLQKKFMKSSAGIERLAYDLEIDDRFILPSGIMFIRETKDPWMKIARGANFCWFNTVSGRLWKMFAPDSIADFKFCFEKRLMWRWKEDLSNIDKFSPEDCENPNGLNNLSPKLLTSHLMEHIRHACSYDPTHARHSSTSHGSSHSGYRHPQH